MFTASCFRFSVVLAASVALAATTVSAQTGCGKYTIIATRGTGELQGPSAGFASMIKTTLDRVPGGSTYNTVYSANFLQMSEDGTLDIIRFMQNKLSQCPGQEFAMLGYSQGAAATVEALVRIKDAATFNAVKFVMLLGNPRHTPGARSNVDSQGNKATAGASGLSAALGGIPPKWDSSGKVLDVCAIGDSVCDRSNGFVITPQHLSYPTSQWTQSAGAAHMISAFTSGPRIARHRK